MNSFLMAEINMTLVVFVQLILPIVFALWLRKQSHRELSQHEVCVRSCGCR